jgi:hypothetical protein
MAESVEHPDKDELTDEKEFEFAEGSVVLKTSDGSPLDLKMSIWLLESVRHYIMKLSFEES